MVNWTVTCRTQINMLVRVPRRLPHHLLHPCPRLGHDLSRPRPASQTAGRSPGPEKSRALREKLIEELGACTETKRLTAWAGRSLPQKNHLAVSDATKPIAADTP